MHGYMKRREKPSTKRIIKNLYDRHFIAYMDKQHMCINVWGGGLGENTNTRRYMHEKVRPIPVNSLLLAPCKYSTIDVCPFQAAASEQE
jgi:hypothetical protein